MIINLSIDQQPDVRMTEQSHWLHPRQVANNSQSVKAKAAVREMVDGLQSEGVWSTMGNFVSSIALEHYVPIAPKDGPNTTHFINCKWYTDLPLIFISWRKWN